jgi:outer membrane protein TolC
LTTNPALRALGEKLKAEEGFADFRKRDFYPTALAQVWNSYEQNRYLLYPHVTGMFVGLSWNLFDGGIRASRVREAQLEVQKTQAQLEDARRGVAILVDQAWREYQQSLQEAITARLNEEASAENLRILEDQYREGLVRTTDALDAEALLAESRFTLAAQRYRAYQKQGALLALCGENLAAFYADLPAPLAEEH